MYRRMGNCVVVGGEYTESAGWLCRPSILRGRHRERLHNYVSVSHLGGGPNQNSRQRAAVATAYQRESTMFDNKDQREVIILCFNEYSMVNGF